ncbi:hypothetical protein MBLNU230_g2316t1 [Neophaeotheca triangularis]
MSSPTSNTWQDRRGLFQRGKELHEPGKPARTSGELSETMRRASTTSSSGSAAAGLEKTMSGSSAAGGATAAGNRRRSSNQNGSLFNNLNQQKRGSQDYGERRASWAEMQGSAGQGVVSGWFNKTFRGVQPGSTAAAGAEGGAGLNEGKK